MTDLASFLRDRLDEDEAAANEATWHEDAAAWHVIDRGEFNPVTKKPRSMHDVRYVVIDSLDDCVTEIDAEASDDGGIARHVARHDPARVLREVAVWRRLLLEYSIPPGTDAKYGGTERETGFRLALSAALKAKIATYPGNPVTGEPFPSGQARG